ncbi:MAG: rhlE [Bacteroidetes bacterium]|nr:rhlE [Bacteroidota bacterium]
MPFKTLGLSDPLLQGILATGYTAPTEIQSRAIPVALEGKDIIATSKTGSGKTAAFVLPILHRLVQRTEAQKKEHHIRALILTPTRELAQQIEDSISTYGRFVHARTVAIYGGTNMQNQIKHLHRGVDMVVATPGRLLDLLQQKHVNLSRVDVLVLDEADRMFDMGFIQDVKRIVSHTPKDRQTMMFSATIFKEVRELMSAIQKHPVLIEIGEQRSPVESVTHHFYSAPQEKKMDLLFHMLDTMKMNSVLIFSRTKHGADKISHRLERRGIKSVAIHSNRTQAQRQRALDGFKQGQFRVLVATDVAARGIDVEGISHVVNYDIPSFPEDYIHRIGRTGRANASGDAITFVGRDEMDYLKKLERFTSKRYELKKFPGFDYAKPPEVVPHTPTSHRQPTHRPRHSQSSQRQHQEHSRRPPHQQPRRVDNQTSQSGQQPRNRPHGRPGRPQQHPERDRKYSRPYSQQSRGEQKPRTQQRKEDLPTQPPRGHPQDKDWRKLLGDFVDKFAGKKKKKRLKGTKDE